MSAGVVIVAAVLALLVGQAATHPKVSRQQAIQAALKWGDAQPYPRVEAKYMRSSDLAAGTGDVALRSSTSDYFVWVVAVSGLREPTGRFPVRAPNARAAHRLGNRRGRRNLIEQLDAIAVPISKPSTIPGRLDTDLASTQ